MRKVKILHIQVLPIMSGVQKAMLDILERLDRNKYDITILCNSEGELTQAADRLNFHHIILPELKREIHPFYDMLALIKLIKIIRRNRFQLVHTHSSKSGFIGRFAARAAGVPCIVHTVQGFAFHEFSSRVSVLVIGFLERIASLVTDEIIFVNHHDRVVAAQLKLAPRDKMVTIHNGIDLTVINPGDPSGDSRRPAASDSNGAVVGMVARLWEQKAPQDFIRSIPVVLRELPDAKFMVIGDGHLRPQLEQLTAQLRIADNVRFLGWRKDVRDLLKQLDVFVLPSLWEGLPVSILEAMASGKPVVASDIKGNNELVVHGETGFLVPPGQPDKIGESVLKLLKNRTLAQKMGLKGYRRVKEKFDINDTIGKINREYDTLLAGKLSDYPG